MGVTIQIDGEPEYNASGFSVTEDATPIDASNLIGGVGQFTVSTPEKRSSKFLNGREVSISDSGKGTTVGIARGVSGDGLTATVTADSRLYLFNAVYNLPPYTGTLSGLFEQWMAIVGIDSGYVIDESFDAITLNSPGFVGNVWDALKALCVRYSVEVALVSSNVVFRPLRLREVVNYRDSQVTWSLDETSRAQSFEVYWYETETFTDELVYPLGGWNPDVAALQGIDAGQTQVFNLPLFPASGETGIGVSLTSINPPVVQTSVSPGYVATSVYTVIGNDGLPIPTTQWDQNGGSLTVAIAEDSRSIDVTVTGMNDPTGTYAPYRIALSSGDTVYSTLRITGDGIRVTKKKFVWQTGLPENVTSTDVGTRVENEWVDSRQAALDIAMNVAPRYSSAAMALSVTSIGVNRRGDVNSYTYPTLGDANEAWSGMTLEDLNDLFSGGTLSDVTDYLDALVVENFENQSFGNVAGARVLNDSQYYRVSSATQNELSITYSADRDTLVSDLNTAFAGLTLGDLNDLWAGKTLGDVSTRPLEV